jgi:parallel beta-helix repeat protein
MGVIFLIGLVAWLVGCGGGSSGGDDDEATVVPLEALAVAPLFPVNGADWNDYVTGSDWATAADSTCDATGACLHGGEHRVVEVPDKSDCAGLEAVDDLGAFVWVCDASTGAARFVSTGLADGKYLSDLLDFAGLAFKPNGVTVSANGAAWGQAPRNIWWSNPVAVNNGGGSLATESTIYLVTADPGASYSFDANKLALVIRPTVAVSGPSNSENVINALSRDYLWLEGRIDAIGDDVAVSLESVRYFVGRNLVAAGSDIRGISLADATRNTLTDVTANDHPVDGILLSSAADNNRLSGVTANNNRNGLSLSNASNNTISGLIANNNSQNGIEISNASNNDFIETTANGNTQAGISLSGSSNTTLSEVTASGNGTHGISLDGGADNTSSEVAVTNNAASGIRVFNSSSNTFVNVKAGNNTEHGITLVSGSGNVLQDVIASNNGVYGVELASTTNNTISGLTASNNTIGISLGLANDNRLSRITTNNNQDTGVEISSGTNNTFIGLTTSNHPLFGIDVRGGSNTFLGVTATNASFGIIMNASGNTLADVTSASNGAEGIYVNPVESIRFTGLLQVGSNPNVNCTVLLLAGFPTPGLENITCNPNGLSDHTLVTGIDLASAFAGQVLNDDAANASDTDGAAAAFPPDSANFDWVGFDNPFRGWGLGGAPYRGRWATVGPGRIWDWSVAGGDNGNAGNPALLNVLTVPTGDDTLTHVWSGAPLSNDDAGCDALVAGSVWNGSACATTFLRRASEIRADGLGNDNTLCESGETCLHMRNIGSYQGHGNLVAVDVPFVDGLTLTGITLLRYENNGR